MSLQPEPRLLTTAEAARLLCVHPKTIDRWARRFPERLRQVRTPGGHWRYHESDVLALRTYGLRERES